MIAPVLPVIGGKKFQNQHACQHKNCNFSAIAKSTLVDHLEQVHNVKVKCKLCTFQSYYPGQLKRHLREKHGQDA